MRSCVSSSSSKPQIFYYKFSPSLFHPYMHTWTTATYSLTSNQTPMSQRASLKLLSQGLGAVAAVSEHGQTHAPNRSYPFWYRRTRSKTLCTSRTVGFAEALVCSRARTFRPDFCQAHSRAFPYEKSCMQQPRIRSHPCRERVTEYGNSI